MKKLLFVLLFIMGIYSVGMSYTSKQTDNAQKYLREAQQYNYAKKKDYRQSRLYTKWANDALSKAQLRLKWAKEARDKARLRMKWANDEMKRK